MIALLLNRYSNSLQTGILILSAFFLVTPESLIETSTPDKAETSYEWSLSENTLTRKNKKAYTPHPSSGSHSPIVELNHVAPFNSRSIRFSVPLYLHHRNFRLWYIPVKTRWPSLNCNTTYFRKGYATNSRVSCVQRPIIGCNHPI